MSYEKAIKHVKNHRKNRYFQQCGFSFKERVESGASIAKRTAEGYYVGDFITGEAVSPIFDDEDKAVDFYNTYPDKTKRRAIFTIRSFGICGCNREAENDF